MLITDYEKQVLKAHKDSNPDLVRAGFALAAACKKLVNLGLMEESGEVTVTGDDILAERPDREG